MTILGINNILLKLEVNNLSHKQLKAFLIINFYSNSFNYFFKQKA